MSSADNGAPRSAIDNFEETLIAVFLGLMTLVTFANVVARYVFNDNLLWALETTVFLFAWLVLLGTCYGVKKSLHLGIDIVVARLSPRPRQIVGLFAIAACLAFSILLLVGSWEYWYPFVTKRAFLEVNDIPMPGFLQFLADWLNEGEKYEKIPRFIPYAVLPISMALLTWRFIQAGIRIMRGDIYTIIASHEAEEMLEESIASQNETRKEEG
jgi:C4-dicarboxylate transporter, DctQ subunit